METSKVSMLDEITYKLKNHLDGSFWQGRGNRELFRESIKKLVSSEILSKEEYNYLLKNERRILVKTQLIHLIPELQSQEILETTVRHLSNVIFEKKYKEAETKREEVEKQIIDQISTHLHNTFHPKIQTAQDAFLHIKQLINESHDISKELLKISNQLLEIRDNLLEKGQSPLLLREIERLSTKLVFASKSKNPEDIPSKEELLEMITKIQNGSRT
ncbi:MAG: hypothetical protein ACTSSG_12330 [Candidatus Heimdallarchaeaceae archaeon]